MEWLYNKNGQAELFTYDDRLISKTGKNLAWIYNGNIYNIKNGKHIGWYENGVLYDSKNKALAFKLNYTGYLPYQPGIGGTAEKSSRIADETPGFRGPNHLPRGRMGKMLGNSEKSMYKRRSFCYNM